MCGIFGYAANENAPVNIRQLKIIALVTERRGDHAFGFAWVDASGKLHSYRQAGPISSSIDELNRVEGARMVIGHTRWATHGGVEDNNNNHPHPVAGGWYVHNGMIRNYRQLATKHGITLETECDSEVWGAMVEQFNGKLTARIQKATAYAATAPLAIAALWAKPARLALVKAGNPIFRSMTKNGFWFASQAEGLPGRSTPLVEDQGLGLAYADGKLQPYAFTLQVPRRHELRFSQYGV